MANQETTTIGGLVERHQVQSQISDLKAQISKWSEGKRDALRVFYAYVPELRIVWLGVVYPKSEKDSLTAAQKTDIKKDVDILGEEFQKRPFR